MVDKPKGIAKGFFGSGWIAGLIGVSFVLALVIAAVHCSGLTGDVGTLVSQIKAFYRSCVPFTVRDSIWKIIHEWSYIFHKPSLHPYFFLLLSGTFVLEYFIPARADQRIFSVGMLQDLFWFVMHTLTRFLLLAAFLGTLHSISQQHLNFLTIQTVHTWPTVVQVAVVVLVSDFLGWFHHYLRHKVWLFWCFHTIHHSQQEINVFTDDRIHPLEPFIANVLIFTPAFMFGLNAPMNFYLAVVLTWYQKFYHANLRTNLGILKYVLVTP